MIHTDRLRSRASLHALQHWSDLNALVLRFHCRGFQVAPYFKPDNIRLYTGVSKNDKKTKKMLVRLLELTK